jgi:hypothetical protein
MTDRGKDKVGCVEIGTITDASVTEYGCWYLTIGMSNDAGYILDTDYAHYFKHL